MSVRNIVFILLLALCICVPITAFAASPRSAEQSLGLFGNWHAYTFSEDGQPVCYMALTLPVPKTRKAVRTPAHLMITHRPADNSRDVISYTAGYNFKPGSNVTIRIGGAIFDLFTVKNTAWTRDAASDRHLSTAILGGKSLTATGIPAKAIKGVFSITDAADLTGASKAYRAIGKACGIGVDEPAATSTKHKKKTP